jgi:hypothetical protein
MLVERDSLWFKVLSARYGMTEGRIGSGGRCASLWWRDMEVLSREEWFQDSVHRVVGNGENTLFWSNVWVGDVSFRVRYSRLYDLSLFKEETVADMCQLGWGVEGQAWSWRRGLFVWEEEMLGELILLLQGVTLQVDKADRWLWNLETSQVFSVRSAYKLLTFQPQSVYLEAVPSLWNNDVPLKVILFVWRLFRDRLPTKDNLFRRGVIQNDSLMCVAGCGSEESLAHLFLHCNFFGSVWYYISRWVGLLTVNPFISEGPFYAIHW